MATTTAATTQPQSILKSYLALTKPSIISLLVFTALGGMFLASEGLPDPMLVIFVLGGGALAAGGANALNHYLDRDIDVLMTRTAKRPVAGGYIPPAHAMWFGIALNVVAFAILAPLVNPLSAVLTLSATLFYVFVYTKGLKRSYAPEHRHRRRGGRDSAHGGLGRRDRRDRHPRPGHVHHRILLDSATLLGALPC